MIEFKLGDEADATMQTAPFALSACRNRIHRNHNSPPRLKPTRAPFPSEKVSLPRSVNARNFKSLNWRGDFEQITSACCDSPKKTHSRIHSSTAEAGL